jgi:hypothetical protein
MAILGWQSDMRNRESSIYVTVTAVAWCSLTAGLVRASRQATLAFAHGDGNFRLLVSRLMRLDSTRPTQTSLAHHNSVVRHPLINYIAWIII